MGENKASEIIQKLLENTFNDLQQIELEEQLKKFPAAYRSYLSFKNEYSEAENSEDIPENPFFVAKVRNRISEQNLPVPAYKKVAWVPYAALASLGISFGIFLGNQVGSASESETDFVTEEFFVGEYDTEGMYVVDFNE
jgi:hypothetical protein